jgi:glycosyltransferase involved in cell wall biosynthesis
MLDTLNVSLVLPTYREKNSIRNVVHEFMKLSDIKEIIIVDNNSEEGTLEQLKDLKVKIVQESKQGYGHAIKAGIINSTQDFICICEPDGTFVASDFLKLKQYISESDLVIGTRTNSIFIWAGANMGFFLKWGNWFVAKLTEILFNTTYLSDVGCTFRILRSSHARTLVTQSSTSGSMFGFEMILNSYILKWRVTQIPVNYLPRVGKSSVTGSRVKTVNLGLQMMGLLFWKKLSMIVSRKNKING